MQSGATYTTERSISKARVKKSPERENAFANMVCGSEQETPIMLYKKDFFFS